MEPTAMWVFTSNPDLRNKQLFKHINDDGGAITARIAIVNFEHAVEKKDGLLIEKIRRNIPRILDEANRAYLKFLKNNGENSWDENLSSRCQIKRNIYAQKTKDNMLCAFIRSELHVWVMRQHTSH